MRRLISIVICLALLAPVGARADDSSGLHLHLLPQKLQSPQKLQLTPQKLQMNGQPGIWLPSDQMEHVLLRLEEADGLESVSRAQDAEIAVQKRQVSTATLAQSIAEKLALEQKLRGDELKNLSEKEEKQIEDLSAWYRSPLLWLGVGITGAAVLGGLLLGLHGNANITVNH